jgi:hypothetical protein
MIACPYAANEMKRFLELVQYPNIVLDFKWVALFKQYVSLYSKHRGRFIVTAGKLLSASPVPMSCSLLMSCTDIAMSQN